MTVIDKSAAARKLPQFTLPDSAGFTPADDFTIEIFGVEFAGLASSCLISHWNAFNPFANQRSWLIQYTGTALQFAASINGQSTTVTVISYAWTPTPNQPYDIAVDRGGNTVRLYVDGAMVASGTISGALHNCSDVLVVGAQRAGNAIQSIFPGLARALRLTNGTARYATDTSYVVPGLPLPVG